MIIKLTQGFETEIDETDSDLAAYSCYYHDGYATRKIYDNKLDAYVAIRLHITILERILGRPLRKGEIADHWDRDSLNNHRKNLRLATYSQNRANSKMNKNNTSGFRGVTKRLRSWGRVTWIAQIGINGVGTHLGEFDTPEKAYEVYRNRHYKERGEYPPE